MAKKNVEETKVVEMGQVENTAEVIVEEPEVKEGFFSKVSGAVKTHGKKLAVGAGVLAVGVIGYALGKGSHDDGIYDDFDVDSFDIDESDDTSSEE